MTRSTYTAGCVYSDKIHKHSRLYAAGDVEVSSVVCIVTRSTCTAGSLHSDKIQVFSRLYALAVTTTHIILQQVATLAPSSASSSSTAVLNLTLGLLLQRQHQHEEQKPIKAPHVPLIAIKETGSNVDDVYLAE